MQQYVKDFCKSRWFVEWDYIECELDWCYDEIEKPHHIECPYKWKRKHKKDWSDLIWLCPKHHKEVHSRNNFDTRTELKEIALTKIL